MMEEEEEEEEKDIGSQTHTFWVTEFSPVAQMLIERLKHYDSQLVLV